MHSTLSENVEGEVFKQDVDRCQMFSSWTEGPFLKMGNVVFGGCSENVDRAESEQESSRAGCSANLAVAPVNNTDLTGGIVSLQLGGGKSRGGKKAGRSASKSRAKPKKKAAKANKGKGKSKKKQSSKGGRKAKSGKRSKSVSKKSKSAKSKKGKGKGSKK